jgi:hypothetical protein
MTNTPDYTVQTITRKEMDRLYTENGFDTLIPSCTVMKIYETPSAMHRAFCCTQRMFRYVDPTCNEEVAIIVEITKTGYTTPSKRIITKLLIGTVIYRHEFVPHTDT